MVTSLMLAQDPVVWKMQYIIRFCYPLSQLCDAF